MSSNSAFTARTAKSCKKSKYYQNFVNCDIKRKACVSSNFSITVAQNYLIYKVNNNKKPQELRRSLVDPMCQNSKVASSKKQNSLVLKLANKFNGQIASKIQSRPVFNRIAVHSDPENIFYLLLHTFRCLGGSLF